MATSEQRQRLIKLNKKIDYASLLVFLILIVWLPYIKKPVENTPETILFYAVLVVAKVFEGLMIRSRDKLISEL